MSTAPPDGSWLPPLAVPPEQPPADPDGPPRWPPWSAVLALGTAFFFAIVGAIVVGLVGTIFGASFRDAPPAVNIAATIVQDVAFVGTAILFAGRAGVVLPAQFGFVRTRLGRAVGMMAVAYVAYAILSQVWAQLARTVLHVPAKDMQDNLPTSLGVSGSTAALVAVCVLVTVIAPLAEETFFRGYFFGALRNWRGPWPAAVLTGLVFGAIHVGSAPAVDLLPLAIFGFALCILRWQTGSLLPCIALHATNNALAFGVTEHWTAGQIVLLAIGAVGVTMLVCLPLLAARAQTA
jgi:hypothetical protein